MTALSLPPRAGRRAQGMRSALYQGTVVHHRTTPLDHRFRYRVCMAFVDLDEIDELCALHPLWSEEGRNVVSFRRADFLGDPAVPLDSAVRDLVAARTGTRPTGPVALLTHLRTWGWLFNPISVYYCYSPDGTTVEWVVAEVTNTPWHERVAYVLPGVGEHHVAKELHVSPFLPMELTHRFTVGQPGERLVLGVDDFRDGEPVFTASLVLDRVAADRRSLGRLLWHFPAMTLRVSAGIYRQALALKFRGVPVHRHPPGGVRAGSGGDGRTDGEERVG